MNSRLEISELQVLLDESWNAWASPAGYVTAINEREKCYCVSAGHFSAVDKKSLSEDTIFEIGSITKVFTALLLADMVAKNKLALTDTVSKFLPAFVHPPDYEGAEITFLDLVTHTSGLPRLPANFRPHDPLNPYADYDVEHLYECLDSVVLQHPPGAKYEYSNLGFGLLGHILALCADQSYEDLVLSRICSPLGLQDTRIRLTRNQESRMAPGHTACLHSARNWDLAALAGAGALRSTPKDLLRFLGVYHMRPPTDLARTATDLLRVRRKTGIKNLDVGAGFIFEQGHDDDIVWKNGDTGGYSSFMGYSRHSEVGVVLLSNMADPENVSELGKHIINRRFPLPEVYSQKAVARARLASLCGYYSLASETLLAVTLEGNRLLIRATNQNEIPLCPKSETRFFCRAVDAEVTFELSSKGEPLSLVLHQGGQDQRAYRL